MSALKAGDFEVVSSEGGCFDKAIDVTAPGPHGAVAPPYRPYPSNANQITPSGNPFAAELFRDRWYGALCMRR
jgi:hypothetical protein